MTRTRHTTKHPGISFRWVDEEDESKGRRWIVGFTDVNGDYHTKTLPLGSTQTQAIALRASLNVRRQQGDTLIPFNKTVGELLDEWLKGRKSSLKPTSVEVYEWSIKHIKDQFGRRKVVDLRVSDVAKLISDLKTKGYKTWSVRKILAPLNQALKRAVRDGYLSSNPVEKLMPNERPKSDQKQMRCMEREEIPKLLKASTKRWRPLFSLLLFTGLRISEALDLSWDDIDFENDLIHVREGKTENARRSVMLIPSLRRVLTAWKLQSDPGVQLVFPSATGGRQSRSVPLITLRRLEEKIGLPDYSLHEFRHTYVSILISQGETPAFIAKQVGHASPSFTLERYAHLFDREANITRARDRLQETFGGMV